MELQFPIQGLLLQIQDVLERMDDAQYSARVEILSGATTGQHVRHVLEFLEELQSGYDSGLVNYDRRRRSLELETSRSAAVAMLSSLVSTVDRPEKDLMVAADVGGVSDEGAAAGAAADGSGFGAEGAANVDGAAAAAAGSGFGAEGDANVDGAEFGAEGGANVKGSGFGGEGDANVEGSGFGGEGFVVIRSNYSRELLYNIEHIVHHMALLRVAIAVVAGSIRLPAGFGVAASTLKYRQRCAS